MSADSLKPNPVKITRHTPPNGPTLTRGEIVLRTSPRDDEEHWPEQGRPLDLYLVVCGVAGAAPAQAEREVRQALADKMTDWIVNGVLP